ncbi:MAG: putative glycoside hydrolase [Patescibacteria group bacterium]
MMPAPRESVRLAMAAGRGWIRRYFAVFALAAAVPAAVFLARELPSSKILPMIGADFRRFAGEKAAVGPGPAAVPAVPHKKVPGFVRGLYVTSSTAGDARRFEDLVKMAERAGINTLVIDIKNDNGDIAFAPADPELKPYAAEKMPIADPDAFTRRLHDRGFYLIARQFVFQDPAYVARHPEQAVRRAGGALWRNNHGVPWIDAAARDAWQYNAAIAKDAHGSGFDEIQFDYVRFPSDGKISDMRFPFYDGKTPKAEIMGNFFAYLDDELRVKNGIAISVDLFGLVMWQHEHDLGIGQRLSDAVPHFDYVSPMVYPSHYPPGFDGYANPALFPYEIVYKNLVRGRSVFEAAAATRVSDRVAAGEKDPAPPPVASVRPWIQDFTLGAVYTPDMVRAQIKASIDGGASGWLLWNARNVYTESALK